MKELSRYAKRQLFARSKKILAESRADYATRAELASIYGVQEITVRQWAMRSEGFPKGLQTNISGRHHPIYYKKTEVQAWLDKRARGRSHAKRVSKAVA